MRNPTAAQIETTARNAQEPTRSSDCVPAQVHARQQCVISMRARMQQQRPRQRTRLSSRALGQHPHRRACQLVC